MKYLIFFVLLLTGNVDAQQLPSNPNETVEVRVLDVGAGLCNLIKMPGNKYIIYDAGGNYNTNGNRTVEQIKNFIPAGSEIELMVLSHTDADHIVAAGQVIREYKVKKLLWGGYERSMIDAEQPTAAYQRIIAALQAMPNTININLNQRDSVITPGNHFTIGTTTITFLCGFGKPLAEWGLTDKAEKLNAVSIVMRLDFAGNSVLFCGDAVGRHRDDPEDALIATEKFMVERAPQYLPSTVIIAPHHGAKNASSAAFVKLVKPKAVIFSAGHRFHHPETSTALRYLQYVSTSSMFRTDRGDDEGGTEWDYLRVPGTKDGYNDDNIDILLKSDYSYRVFYLDN